MKTLSISIVLIGSLFANLIVPVWAAGASQDEGYTVASQKEADELEKLQQPYIEQARNSYPQAKERFLNGLPRSERFYLTVKLRDSSGKYEAAFVEVKSIADGTVNGVIANKIELVKGFKQGQTYSFPESEIIDWTIVTADGTEEGNFVGKFMDEYQARQMQNVAGQYASEIIQAQTLGEMLYEAEIRDQILDKSLVESAKNSVSDFCPFSYKPVQVNVDGEIVTYLLGFSKEKGSVVFGRHYKITPSGKNVSTVTCYESGKSREKPVALVITQLVAPSPTEFMVYLSLKYKMPIYVGTKPGMWRVSDGKIEFVKVMQ